MMTIASIVFDNPSFARKLAALVSLENGIAFGLIASNRWIIGEKISQMNLLLTIGLEENDLKLQFKNISLETLL